ncbi:hypothetical protein O1611_g361 [Lasiodiplodia mahajangana]|uniref:Uncharacterized protein n=1 Tax=Lasiodiplodia mahajangana TaxID=1108764 RepID=A0ACC2K1C5_9PEZI|nr:hypothetical protein O1611_g361 [Lasiodiplodia mahajangana]
MAVTFDLGTYECDDLPRTLWRVIHPQTQSRQDLVTGDLVARDSDREISDESSLTQVAKEHFNWNSRQASCFLSVFSDEDHARNWARLRKGKVDIHEIDATKLPLDTCVFDATSLARSLGIVHPYSTHEFIFLHRIPSCSLRRRPGFGEIRKRVKAPRYVPGLIRLIAFDEKPEECDRSDDIMKLMVGAMQVLGLEDNPKRLVLPAA